MLKAMLEATPRVCIGKRAGVDDVDTHLIEACQIFQEVVTDFGGRVSAMHGLSDDGFPSDDETARTLAIIRELRADWQTIAWRIIEMPARSDCATQAKVDAIAAYFLNVGDAVECIGLRLAQSLVTDLQRAREAG